MSANLHLKLNDLPDCRKQPVRALLIGIIAACIFVVALPFISCLAGLYSFLVAAAAAIVVLNIFLIKKIVTLPAVLTNFFLIDSAEAAVASISFSPFAPFTPPRCLATV